MTTILSKIAGEVMDLKKLKTIALRETDEKVSIIDVGYLRSLLASITS